MGVSQAAVVVSLDEAKAIAKANAVALGAIIARHNVSEIAMEYTAFEMGDGAAVVERVSQLVYESGSEIALTGLRANGWDRWNQKAVVA